MVSNNMKTITNTIMINTGNHTDDIHTCYMKCNGCACSLVGISLASVSIILYDFYDLHLDRIGSDTIKFEQLYCNDVYSHSQFIKYTKILTRLNKMG